MENKIRQQINKLTSKIIEAAPDVILLEFPLVNLFMIGKERAASGEWVLVDTGTENSAEAIFSAAEKRFGKNSIPGSIILTHGHFDHVGAIKDVLEQWNIPVYAHKNEIPYLTGRKEYLPPDPTVDDGLLAKLSPLFPKEPVHLGDKVKPLPDDGSIPGLPEWKWIHTPGHTPGQISLFRERDRVLISADAVTTVKQESALAVLTKDTELHGPPAYFTTDWHEARLSVERIRNLNPSIIISSHGLPMKGEEMQKQLDILTHEFENVAVPDYGRYIE
ncbi:MAG: MBL fold metallo-hydrolase [Bacillota bacterium]